MLAGLIMLIGTGIVSTLTYGVGRLHGYDKWDKDNAAFQKGIKGHG